MEEAYQEYRQRQGQRAKALELKQTKAVKPGDLFQPTEEVGPFHAATHCDLVRRNEV